MIAEGVSPALEKQRAKRRLREARDFAHVAQKWMDEAPMADSTATCGGPSSTGKSCLNGAPAC